MHLGGVVACARPLRRRVVYHGSIVRRGGGGVGAAGEEGSGARSMTLSMGLTIVGAGQSRV